MFDWKKLATFNQEDVLGLDIGSSAVKMVQLRKDNGNCEVKAAGIFEIARTGQDDKNSEQINIVRAIRKCLSSTSIDSRFAVCSVCGPEVAVRSFKFPSLPQEEIPGAVSLEASQVCPFYTDDSTVDYKLIPDGTDNISGVLVAATNTLIKTKQQLAKDASLGCVLMDIDGLALLNCLESYEKSQPGRTTAILNVGSSFTNLAIAGDNTFPFVRDLPHAGDDIIVQIATDNDIPVETVRKILYECESSEQLRSEFGDSLEKACQKLVVDVSDTLRYYSAQEHNASVEQVFVSGGFVLVKGFVELLDKQLPCATVAWNPFERIQCAPDADQAGLKELLKNNGPALAVAAGLAVRSI